MSFLPNAKKVLDIEREGLESISNHLGNSFDQAIEAILRSLDKNGKVVVVGIGSGGC